MWSVGKVKTGFKMHTVPDQVYGKGIKQVREEMTLSDRTGQAQTLDP